MMLRTIRKLIRKATRPTVTKYKLERRRRASEDPAGAMERGIRRWESAETHRLNRSHWQNATGNPINEDLAQDLDTLRARCAYEAANNPIFEGVIFTHSADVVGPEGPTLRVLSDDEKYNDEAEDVFADWTGHPDATGTLSWPDLLQGWIGGGWKTGELLAQLVTDRSVFDDIRVRVLDLDPRRLQTPWDKVGDPNIVFGVRRNNLGQPLTYYIQKPQTIGAYTLDTGDFDPIPAADILHGFRVLEPGQARGVPWGASALDTLADLRDFDAETLDAARAAAQMGVLYYADHPDAPFVQAEGERSMQRQSESFIPPGYRALQLNPAHPGPNYVDYRRMKAADIGRPVQMPGLLVLLSADKHNLSSARFDNQRYASSLLIFRFWLAHRALDRTALQVLKEAEQLKKTRPRPKRIRLKWAWWNLPQVDPHRDAQAQEIRLVRTKTTTLTEELAAEGKKLDDHVATKAKEKKAFEKAGLAHPDDTDAPTPQLSGKITTKANTKTKQTEGASA